MVLIAIIIALLIMSLISETVWDILSSIFAFIGRITPDILLFLFMMFCLWLLFMPPSCN